MKTMLLVGGIVVKDNKILILKRLETKKVFPGYWDLPGGKIDLGESPESAVVRETKEETGLDVEIIRPYNTWTFIFEYNNTKEYCVQIDFIVKAKNIENIKLSDSEHSEYAWVDENSTPEKISNETRSTIAKAFREMKNL